MIKTLFWIIVAACVAVYFPAAVISIAVLVLLFFVACFTAVWVKDRRETKRLEEEQKQAEVRRCEFEAAERKRTEEQAQIAQKWAKIYAKKREDEAHAAEQAHRSRAERIAKYNRLAQEASTEGDFEPAECWRRLAVEELKKYKST